MQGDREHLNNTADVIGTQAILIDDVCHLQTRSLRSAVFAKATMLISQKD